MSDWKPWYEEMAGKSTEAERNAVLYGTFAPPPPDYANMAVNFGAGYVLGKSLRTLWRGIFNR
jgi:hypothetical protein